MADFLFHKVSEEEKSKIQEEAKDIMDRFSKKLEEVSNKIQEPLIERKEWERKEGSGEKENEDFRKRLFANAPNKSGDFIVAEKKGW